ncbi:hypothetical protein ISN45_Aa01g011080, partial [Arabidopsis thaliana x Arabidopsis arenosa]
MMCLNNCTYYQIFSDEYHLFLRQTLINCLVNCLQLVIIIYLQCLFCS